MPERALTTRRAGAPNLTGSCGPAELDDDHTELHGCKYPELATPGGQSRALLVTPSKCGYTRGCRQLATVASPNGSDKKVRDRHTVILDYLKTAPGVLTGVAAVLAALTGLLAVSVR